MKRKEAQAGPRDAQGLGVHVKITQLRQEVEKLCLLHTIAACEVEDIGLTRRMAVLARFISVQAKDLLEVKRDVCDEAVSKKLESSVAGVKWNQVNLAANAARKIIQAPIPVKDLVEGRLQKAMRSCEDELKSFFSEGSPGKNDADNAWKAFARLVCLKGLTCDRSEQQELIKIHLTAVTNGGITKEDVDALIAFTPCGGIDSALGKIKEATEALEGAIKELDENTARRSVVLTAQFDASEKLDEMGVKAEEGGEITGIIRREAETDRKYLLKKQELVKEIEKAIGSEKEFRSDPKILSEKEVGHLVSFWKNYYDYPVAPLRLAESFNRLAFFAAGRKEDARVLEFRREAVKWGEKALGQDALNRDAMVLLEEAYSALGEEEKARVMHGRIAAHDSTVGIIPGGIAAVISLTRKQAGL